MIRENHCCDKNNANEKPELKINDVVIIRHDKFTPLKNWRKK